MNKIVKNKIKMLFISIFFGFVNLFSLTAPVQNAYAEPVDGTSSSEQTVESTTSTTSSTTGDQYVTEHDLCREGLDNISWLLCPKVEKGSSAVDYIYEKIESVLEINPISGESGSIIVKIWEICRGITNIVFVILLLLVVLSQITGIGITNYGIKRALPKLIIAAIAVNLSFYICSLGVDLSNTFGISIRNLFAGIEGGITGTPEVYSLSAVTTHFADYYENLAHFTGTAAVGGALALESGVIFMLIPAVLVALVAVLSGFITIALRQVVVVLCVMIAPLAIVAMVFPNTYSLFRKWRHTLLSMLVFFPMFSLLFGASSLAGFAIIQAAGEDGFMQLVGMVIQLAPLILCWKMMKMSGTVLGGVHGTVSGFLTGMLVNPARRYAGSLAAHRRARTLAQVNPYTPSAKLMQYLEDRRISREMDIAEYSAHAKQRAAAFNSNKKYKFTKDGRIKGVTKDGEEAYSMQAKNMRYQQEILRDKNAMNQGLGTLPDLIPTDDKQKARLFNLDLENVNAADALFNEQIHANDIAYKNALGRAERYDRAINARVDGVHRHEFGHRDHDLNSYSRYRDIYNIMGSNEGVYYAAASAASVAESQKQIREGQFQKFFDSTVPTQDVVNRLKDLTTSADAAQNIEAIVAGMRTLNKRGDHLLLLDALDDLMNDDKILLGSSASQTLANFLIGEVKGSEPFLRRLGKYINLETARYYNTDKVASGSERKRQAIDINEFVLGGYDLRDENGNLRYDKDGNVMRDVPKRGATQLLMGTSYKDIEREAFPVLLRSVANACGTDYKLREKINENFFNATLANTVGDQFSYASGSEQVNSWALFVTGKKVVRYENNDVSKPVYEDDVEYLKLLSPDLKRAKQIVRQRAVALLGAEVANQASKQKTDVIYPIRDLFIDMAREEFLDKEHSQAYKEWVAWEDELKSKGCEVDTSKIDWSKDNAEEEFAINRFAHYQYLKSLKPSVRAAVAKQFAKGLNGDAKENTYEMLGFNDFKDRELIRVEANKFNMKKPGQDNYVRGRNIDYGDAIVDKSRREYGNDAAFNAEMREQEELIEKEEREELRKEQEREAYMQRKAKRQQEHYDDPFDDDDDEDGEDGGEFIVDTLDPTEVEQSFKTSSSDSVSGKIRDGRESLSDRGLIDKDRAENLRSLEEGYGNTPFPNEGEAYTNYKDSLK